MAKQLTDLLVRLTQLPDGRVQVVVADQSGDPMATITGLREATIALDPKRAVELFAARDSMKKVILGLRRAAEAAEDHVRQTLRPPASVPQK